MFDLDMSGRDPKSLSTRTLVFQLLRNRFPLTMADMTRLMKSEFGVKLTYQAVRKAVNALEEQGILVRTDDGFQINREWLLRTKSVIDRILLEYDGDGNPVHGSEEYSVYTVHTLFEADNFWGDRLIECAADARSRGMMDISCFWHYAWWMVINFGRETQLFAGFLANKHDVAQYVFRDLPLNRWAAEIYSEQGTKMIFNDSARENELVAFNIVGDFVIQVEFPEDAVKRIKDLFEAHESIQDVDRKEISDLAHAPYSTRFTIFRNQLVAANLRESMIA